MPSRETTIFRVPYSKGKKKHPRQKGGACLRHRAVWAIFQAYLRVRHLNTVGAGQQATGM